MPFDPVGQETMERFNPELTLTSSETAYLLGVHPSTVKRWCGDAELPFSTTEGGHRRIHLEDAVAFARQQGITTVLTPFHPYEPHVWTALQEVRSKRSFGRIRGLAMGWAARGRLRRVGALFDALFQDASVPVCSFLDGGIRGFMHDVGEAWSQGRLRVGEEHSVSQVMVEVLFRACDSVRTANEGSRPGGATRVAVVGALEGNQHHLGSMSARLLLESRGWDVVYLGPDVPIEDFGALQASRDATLVCIGLTPPPAAGDIVRATRILAESYDPGSPYALAFGGYSAPEVAESAEPLPFTDVGVFDGCTPFEGALEQGFGLAPGSGPAA